MNHHFLYLDDSIHGPLATDVTENMLRAGTILPDTPAADESSPEWLTVGPLFNLPSLSAPPPTSPSVQPGGTMKSLKLCFSIIALALALASPGGIVTALVSVAAAATVDASLAYASGYNNEGELGNNSNVSSSVPVAVDASGVLAGKTITLISAGFSHSLALCSDGTLAAWGYNDDGELGNNIVASSSVP